MVDDDGNFRPHKPLRQFNQIVRRRVDFDLPTQVRTPAGGTIKQFRVEGSAMLGIEGEAHPAHTQGVQMLEFLKRARRFQLDDPQKPPVAASNGIKRYRIVRSMKVGVYDYATLDSQHFHKAEVIFER